MATGATTSGSYLIPIGRRIEEILDERGAAYLVGFFANRIQFDPRRLVAILRGELQPTSFDLEQIAKGLNLSVERLTQQDTLDRVDHIQKMIQARGTSEDVVREALELAELAQGATERCDALNNLGKVYYQCGRLDDAFNAFTQAYAHYKPVMDRNTDFDRAFRLFNNLIFIYNVRKDTEGLAQILEHAETIAWQDPVQSGNVFFASAVVQYERGHISNAKLRFQQCLTAYRQSGDLILIGGGEYNLGRLEYLTGNDALAIEYLQSALQNLSGDRWKLRTVVDYLTRSLIQIGELEQAKHLIEEYEDLLGEQPDVLAMLYLQHAYQLGDPAQLAEVLELAIVKKELKASGYKHLMTHFSEIGDAVAVMKYFRLYLLVDSQPSSFEDLMLQRRETP